MMTEYLENNTIIIAKKYRRRIQYGKLERSN
jgi:hypothetical protein